MNWKKRNCVKSQTYFWIMNHIIEHNEPNWKGICWRLALFEYYERKKKEMNQNE